MKTAYDIFSYMCACAYHSPFYTCRKCPKLTVLGHMFNIAANMVLGGEY